MSTKTLLPLYHIYVECKEEFSWLDCEETISKKLPGNCNLFAMVNDEFENIQNALLSSQEDISHINAQVTELFFVAIPSSNFSFRDFIKFAKIDLNEIVGSVRTINPFTKQHSICIKFQNIENAQKCFLRCHGKKYGNTNDICHVLFAVKFEIVTDIELLRRFQQMREYKYLQMPLCPSCLERLDPTISNVWPHYCDEIENNSSFYNQIIASAVSIESSPNRNTNNNSHRIQMDNIENNNSESNAIIGIEQTDNEFSEFVHDNYNTSTSAGVCRCIQRWIYIECPVCNKINENTTKQREIEKFQEEEKLNKNCSPQKIKTKKISKKKGKKKSKIKIKKKLELENKNNSKILSCCSSENELWICLICGHIGCGRFKQSHALQHFMKTQHSFCCNLHTLSVWDYKNDIWQHRLFQKRTLLCNETQRERQRLKQQQQAVHITPGGPNDNNNNNNDNIQGLQPQPLDEYSRIHVMAKLDNVREYYNRLLLDVIQQQTQWHEYEMKDIQKENEIKCKQKKDIIKKLKEECVKYDKEKEAIELWNKVQEMRWKNLLKKKEFQQTVNKTRAHKKELEKMKNKYDKKEQRLRQQKDRQKQVVQEEIDNVLVQMTQ